MKRRYERPSRFSGLRRRVFGSSVVAYLLVYDATTTTRRRDTFRIFSYRIFLSLTKILGIETPYTNYVQLVNLLAK